ncbi:magnesium/cobalt transporter CorA [Halorientalis pallida]|uniref:Magnesium transport protein CorA n=1 Tax=Halorientalis pallida TaxID=2479928 RepID=A0A498L3Z0_9EURY|nr:magnesium/cobalt transporter CorA [Halorientalis pallida]RXK52051.1 magnesium/cobalt transporter CorA [Halorientalis pallida]
MIATVVYGPDGATEYNDLAAARDAVGTTWVRVSDANPGELDAVAETFEIHSLVVEDVRNEVRAKTQSYDDYAFTLVKTVELARGDQPFEEEIRAEAVGICVGEDWVVSLSVAPDDPVDRVWDAVLRDDRRILDRGPDFVAYRLVDMIVDEYFTVLDDLETDIEAIEEAVTVSTDIGTLEDINALRRDLLAFRKVAWPCREAVGVLARGGPSQVREETEKYYRDVYDHLAQVVDLTETYRDLTTGTRDIYLNTLSQSTNEVMKVLTVIATIFLPLTFVAGVYGMNFVGSPYNMPELTWRYGYPAVLLGMGAIAGGMLVYFRRKEYL